MGLRRSLAGHWLALLILLAAAPAAGDGAEAQALVRSTADKVLAEVKANKARLERDSSGIYDLVQRFRRPAFRLCAHDPVGDGAALAQRQ